MKLYELIEYIDEHGIAVSVINGKLNLEAPEGALTDMVMDALRANKAAVAAHFGRSLAALAGADAPVAAGDYPLSFAQQRLFFIQQFDPAIVHFNLATELTLADSIDPGQFVIAVNRVVNRHPIHQVRYLIVDGKLRQRFDPAARFQTDCVDLRERDPEQQEAALAARRELHGNTPFDLAREPAVRACLFMRGAAPSILMLAFHHIATDAWSIRLLTEEIVAEYRHILAGQEATAAAPALAYFNYAAWQQTYHAEGGFEVSRSFWQQELAQLDGALELPFDAVRPAQQSYSGALRTIELDGALGAQVGRHCVQHGFTEFSAYLGAYALLLYKLSGKTDLVIGTDTHGRDHPALRQMIGFFVNQLALRINVDPLLVSSQFLASVHRTVLRAFDYQDMPFDQIVDDLKIERDLAYSPVFQVKFLFDQAGATRAGQLVQAEQQQGATKSQYDLTLKVEADRIVAFYNADLFSASTVDYWLRCYVELIAAMASPVDTALADLLRNDLADALCKPEAPADTRPCANVLAQIEQAIAATPDACAVAEVDACIDYRTLGRRMRQLSAKLRALGVKRGDRIAVYLDRSIDMTVAMLAVMRVGAVFVPLDTSYPLEHIQFTLADSAAAIVISERDRADDFWDYYGFVLDIAACDDIGDVAEDSTALPQPDDIAYLLYTSGSTGNPKGVLIRHASLDNLCAWYVDFAEIAPASRVMLMIPIGFDASIKNILAPLMCGATLVLAGCGPFDAEALLRQIDSERVTLINCAPSAFHALLKVDRQADFRRLACLRMVALGGEALDLKALNSWLASPHCNAILANVYGPTECADISLAFKASAAQWLQRKSVTIGLPIPNTRAYIVDQYLKPCLRGVTGELLIAGAGVGAGYHQLPVQTADSFVELDWVEGTAYRTGDYCRVDHDGNVIYQGRRDGQVKIRGKRVELQEIALRLSELLADTRVSVQLYARDQVEMLVAFAEGEHDGEALAQARTTLGERLPRHMIPHQIVAVAHMPLTDNGKICAQSLFSLFEAQRAARADNAVVALDPTETLLAGIWQSILGIEVSDRACDFFTAGGDSILSIQLIAQLREHGYAVTVVDVFKYPTLAELAQHLARSAQLAAPAQTGTVAPFALIGEEDRALVPAGVEDAYPLTSLQAGMMFHVLLEQTSNVYHDVFSTQLRFDFDVDVLRAALADVLALNPVLRTGIDLTAYSEPLQLVYAHAEPLWEVIDISDLPDAEQAAFVDAKFQEIKQSRLDLAGPSLIRFHILVKAADRVQFIVDAHHVIVDGWSMATMQRQLFEQYWHKKSGSALSDVFDSGPTRFADYVARHLGERDDVASKAYWDAYLAAGHASPLPDSYAGQSGCFQRVGLDFAPGLNAALLDFSTHSAIPVKTLFLMAHGQMLRSFLDGALVSSGVTDHGRLEVHGAQNVLGLFLNVLPVTFDFAKGTWRALAGDLQGVDSTHKAHRGYPFAAIAAQHPALRIDALFTFNNFHVLDGLLESQKMEVGATFGFEETNFPLGTLVSGNPAAGFRLALTTRLALRPADLALLSQQFILALKLMMANFDEGVPGSGEFLLPLCVNGGLPGAHCVSELVFDGMLDAELLAHTASLIIFKCRAQHPDAGWLAAAAPLSYREVGSEGAHDRLDGSGAGEAALIDITASKTGRNVTLIIRYAAALAALPHLGAIASASFEQYLALAAPARTARVARDRQAGWYAGFDAGADRRFWSGHLADAPARLELPVDFARQSQRQRAASAVPFVLPAELAAALLLQGEQHGVALSEVLLGAWATLLSRLACQEDLVLGVEIDGSCQAGEAAAGGFTDMTALRLQVDAQLSVAGLLARIRATLDAVAPHLAFPFDQLDANLQLQHQVQFVFGKELAASAQTELALSMGTRGGALGGTLHYADELFSAETAQRFIDCFIHLLGAFAGDAAQRCSRLSILSEAQRDFVLAGLNSQQTVSPASELVHQLFEARVLAAPAAPAIVFGEQSLSYDALNRRANRLAHCLIAHGVKADDRVALCMARGPDLIVAMLAILKAGAGYVPLDPAYPEQRLAWMLDDSAPSALVTDAEGAARWAGRLPACPVIALAGPDSAALAGQPDGNPDPSSLGLVPSHLAYVIYTSGTSGQPKGVMVTHRNIAQHIAASIAHYGIGAGDCVLQFTSISFDPSAEQILCALGAGARLLLRGEHVWTPEELGTLLRTHAVSVANIAPAYFASLGETLAQADSLRLLIVGGDKLGQAALESLPPGCTLLNAYGPTETTVTATTFALEAGGAVPAVIPIGKPYGNTRVYVLDAYLQPVPLGVSGEIHIGGAGVARGYLNRPELTAERFVADPFSSAPDARMYKTGDLGRWRADGQLEYLGRNDFQVKVRGFRIELGEIEARLVACAGVREAVVLALAPVQGQGDARLVAYLTARPESDASALEPGALRQALLAHLPEYMVPGAFVTLAALPLTPNGKLDRKALPAPDGAALALARYAAPQGATEQALAAIWQELLGVERVGREDHFFDLGGHSLLAVQLASRVRQRMGAELPLRTLFARPLLRELAGSLAQLACAPLAPMAAASRAAPLPLSFAQQRLWFLDQLDHAAGAAYHMPAGLRLSGQLDTDALVRALDRIVARHESLRTCFVEVDGMPWQRIGAAGQGMALARHDLSHLRGHEQEQALAAQAQDESAAPFDLARGPLIRARLLRLGEREHVLLVTQHHIVSDGWSVGVLVREFAALYTAFRQALEDPLAPLAIQYADYALWQRDYLQGEALERQRGFWSAHLAGAPALLELPTDHPRPARQSHTGASVAFALPAALTAQLQALGQRHGATLFMVLLGAWSVLMSRLSGQDDVVIGTPVANRQRAEVEPLIGFFVNTLAVRVRLDADLSVAQLLEQVKGTLLDAYAHQDIPFEQVVETLNPTRSLSHSPLFQVMLTLNNTPPGAALALPGLRLAQLEQPGTVTPFDLSLALVEVEGGLACGLTFATDLFEEASISRLIDCWRCLLDAMAGDEHARTGRLPLLTSPMRKQLLSDFNASSASFPAEKLIHQLFEEQVVLQAATRAVTYEGSHLSYGELNDRANQLAHYLIGLGVGPDVRVAICLERSLDLVVGLLAILKAGGAYVPLDPTYPRERLADMLADCAPRLVLTLGALAPLLPPLGTALVCLDAIQPVLCAQALGNPVLPALHARHLAYVIYTSGSTGRPKGAMNEHRSVVNRLLWAREEYAIGPDDKILQKTPFGFDVSVWEFFLPLLAGATLVLARPGQQGNAAYLVELIAEQDITVLHFVPSMLQVFLDQAAPLKTSRLRDILCSGEALPHALQCMSHSVLPQVRLHNLYGPTEAAIDVTYWRCSATAHAGIVPIGRPIWNTSMYVLDRHLQPVPLGVRGELYIGGIGVARGYLNRPELTAERFVADPFSPDPDARMYKTGDVGCWLDDGQLEYLGRNDFQVKLRGFRIELGEIEARLLACAGVREAVVVALAQGEGQGESRLVAYLTARPEGDPAALEPGALRQALLAYLPEYMVPGAFVTLAALPLTPNGKLDRKALPAPDGAALALARYAAPQGATEQALAAIWQELLGVERVGREDHFFDLGGHSLLAVQLASRVRQRMGAELPLRTLFARPLLRELAGSLAQLACAPLAPIAAASRAAPLPLSFAQQRLWFLDQFDHAAGAAYHMPAGLRLSGQLDTDALVRALDHIVARHESLRTCFVEIDGVPWQSFGAAGQGMALARHDLSHLRGHEQEQALATQAQDESAAPFDLARGPLIRARLLRLDEQEHVLLVTQHHIVSDGWSVGVLVRELTALYSAFSQALEDPLAPLAIQYADYALWQRDYLQGEALERQRGFWSAHLAGAPALLELPTDHPRPARQSHAGASVAFTLPAALTAQLQALGQRHGATLFMVLLGAWSVLMSRLSGQDDVVIGTPVANRQRAEVEPLIGFFVNTLAVRVRLDADPSVAQLLEQVKHTMLDAYAHQDIPFEQVVETLNPTRNLSHSPLFQVMLTLNNTPPGAASALPGLRLAQLEQPGTVTQFDLSLSLVEVEGGLEGGLTFASDLFELSSIERLLACWTNLLRAMAVMENAECQVHRLPLLDGAQTRRLLVDFNDTMTLPRPGRLLHQLFEEQAALHPDASALAFDGTHCSYGELNRRANQIAHRLIGMGVRSDCRVAVCMDRSLDLVAALLGILKAGGAYVALDPAYPAERLAYLLADSGALALLTTRAHLHRLPDSSAPICLDSADLLLCLAGSLGNPDLPSADSDAAYVIYTSGSTGQPKGVVVEHRNVVNLVAHHVGLCELTAADRVLQFASFGFDNSVAEVFPALSVGACVVLRAAHLMVPDAAFGAFLEAERISVTDLPTSFWHLWADEVQQQRCLPGAALRVVLAGGEKAELRRLRSWFNAPATASARWINTYGPSEATVNAATVGYRHDSALPAYEIPLGRPLDNTTIYVLDRHLQPVPLGVSGEIHIGGAGVARGYLNRPELTAERFVADPFSSAPDARMYKTGDLGRWRADGQLEYLGRNDFQVKLRGFRIELGEIEARLVACAGVREAVVLALAPAQGEGDARLVAYLTATPEGDAAALEPGALRQALLAHLPEYMVPGAFVTLAALPLTPNGKLDRKALPAPDGAALALARYAAPQGATEQALAAIWQELLGVERVGREDHFFDLGGHSLLAVQLASRVRQRMGAELPLRTLFARPLLRELAGSLAQLACAPLAPIAAASRAAPLPLSFAQQRLWFLDQLDHAAAAAYHMPAGLRLSGELDTDALVRALDRIVARHESLRTCFVEVDGMPWQRIGAAGQGMALARHDLSHLRGHEQEQALAAQAQDESAAPFDLARGPLIRARLLRLGEREHVLLVTQHHIVSDGWSVGVLVREFAALYTAFNQALDDPLAPLAIQYADYAAWQRSDEQGKLLARQSGFWSAHLAGAPALLELPTDHPRPARQSHAGASVAFTLPAALTAQLQALGQRHGATLFMVLLGAWSVLMSRLSGQDDVVTGTPVANRQRAEVEPLIGFFVNTLAVRVRLDADPSVAQLLEQVKHTMLDAYAHQDIPFEQVVEAVKPVRSTSHSPLFQTLLTLDNTPDSGPLALPGLTLSGLAMPANLTKFDLTLSLVEQGGQLAGALDFACELFERSSVERLLSYWQVLLASMTAHVERPVSQLPLLDAAQQQAVLARSTAPSAVFPADRLLHQLFEDQAAAQPDALAVVCAGHTLSYAQLNHQANRLAHYLRDLGVGPDALVALYLERGVPMVVGILAVLKAGGAYLPLDPGAPQERSASIVADAGAAVVLTERALVGQAPQVEAVLCLDDDRRWRDLPVQAPVCGATPTSLAYVIYTSGSTGRPKGVMVEHRAVLNLWTALAAAVFDDVRPSRVALNAGIWFDASVKGLVQLLSGHSLHIIPQDVRADGRALLAFLERERIDAFDCTPAQLDQLLDAGLLDATRRPARCLVGGEAIKPASWRRLQADTRTAFYNVYGPTECTVDATVALINGPATPPHLGTPIGNTQLYLLDRHLQLVPPGVSGEIHIGGAGVARGYLNRPELTAERFVADPFSSAPDARMYKTGDLGRWRADGQLEYLGRNDFQVKLRGFRIELGEIEARLVACAGVREAVVLALAQGEGEARLVAYLTATPESDPAAFEPGALRQALLAHLPEYMVPGAFVTLAALPLTPNGKLDRKALPAPDGAALALACYAAPQGATEQALSAIWQELLGVERVGREDHFFDLGGHSLLAVQLASRVRQRMGAELPLRTLFARPLLRELAGSLAQLACAPLAPIAAASRAAPLPLSFAQQRLWFLDQLDHAAGAAYHMPAGLRLSGQLDTDALVRALDRIVARHESLRTCFVEVDGTPWQRIGAAGQGMALARHDLSHLRGHEQEQALAAQAQDESAAPFDLARGPLIRARLLRLGEREHVLLVTQHHIVSDGWSVGVLVREFAALYTAFSQSLDDPLAPLAIQYADYALWQRDYLQGEALERQCSFWSAHLAGAPALLELPTDHPRPARQSHAGASVAFALPAALTAQLQALGQRHGATLFMVLLGAWSVLMSRLSGQDDVVIGTPVANRQRAEVEPLIGFFVNTLAVRVRLDADPSVAQLLEQVKGTLLDAYAHQDIPFEQVVEVVKPVRSLAHSPLFQVMLTLNNTPERRSIVLPGLSLNGIESDVTSAQCDLTMSLTEVDGVLAGELTYASSLFEQGTILRLISAWETVLTAMAGDDQQTSSRVPLLSASERHRVLETFNTTRQGEPAERTIHRIVEKQAENHPKAVALRCDGQALSYSELNRKANQLAHYLIGLGIEPDQRVAICMDRSLDMFVGLLAVLKAGAAYVPLDPGYPLARLRYMIEDSAPRVLLTRQDFASVVPQPGLPVLAIDGKEEAAIAAASAANPQVDALTAGHLAYVIYTSGSTGTPKGVMIDHAAACNLAMAQRQLLGLTATAQVLQFASFSFDACVWEILMAWGAGATLHVAQRDALLPGSSLCGTMRDLGITHATLPSAVLALSPDIAMLPRLHLIAAGEVLQTQLAERLRSRHVLMNAYGPTEATVCATAYLVRDDSPNRVPIGKPLANMRVYILDRHGAPVPVGVRGEMYIGGAGIGRGYLGRADLTAERFVADPFSDKPGARMYKTGDIGRWLDDGNVDYVGRNDTQVKLRGFRIEPGEIESRLRECAGVREAVVVVRAQAAAADTLVAYLTCDTEDGGNSAHWRRHLSELLPDYMVPAHFVVLAAMPLTPNGKIDVGNLPAPQRAALALAAVEEPDGPVETVLAALWCELLGLARVGRNDNFFELGGHSLQVVRLIGRIREQFDVELSPKAVFQSPVLVDLSETIIEAKLAAFSDEELAAMDAELNVLSERELLNLISESKDD